jgi:NADH:ubiquinone oxidoreductase subunit E
MSEHREPVVQLESRVGRPGAAVLERLRMARATRGGLTAADVDRVAAELDLPRAHVNGAAAFYADLGFDGAEAPEAVRVCAGTACLASRASPRAAS